MVLNNVKFFKLKRELTRLLNTGDILMQNVKLSTKLIAGFILIACIIIVGGAVGWYGIYRTENALKQVNDISMPGIQALANIKEAQTSLRVVERSLLIHEFSGNEELKRRQYENAEDALKKMNEASKTFDSLSKSNDQTALWNQMKASWEIWNKDFSQYLALIKSNKREEALSLTNGQMREKNSKGNG
jgi:phosphoglycerate-specific signal transduction histidine kinase